MHNLKITADEHQGIKIIKIQFEHNKELVERLKNKFLDVEWSQSKKAWHVPDNPVNRKKLNMPLKEKKFVRTYGIKEDNQLVFRTVHQSFATERLHPQHHKSLPR